MGFVQAGFLVTLAATAIPVIIHLVFARPRRRVDLGTLRFLQAALTREAGRKRVKRWLLLAIRTGARLAHRVVRPPLPRGSAATGSRPSSRGAG